MSKQKFFILGNCRSRTYWLSKFLATPGAKVGHDASCEFKNLDDLLSSDYDGFCDTALGVHWRDLPGKVIVIDRCYKESIKSLNKIGLGETWLTKRVSSALELAKEVYPSIQYNRLSNEATCKRLFEYLTGQPFNVERWKELSSTNLTAPIEAYRDRFTKHEANFEPLYGSFR